MTKLVVEHADDGTITDWRYEVDDGYEPQDGEITVRGGHFQLGGKRVDPETGDLVDDSEYDPRGPVERLEEKVGTNPLKRDAVSETSKEELAEAIAAIDDDATRQALAVVCDILTGQTPAEIQS